MRKPRTISWNLNGTTKQLNIYSPDAYAALIMLAVLMVLSIAVVIAALIINNVTLGLTGTGFAVAIFLLVKLSIKRIK